MPSGEGDDEYLIMEAKVVKLLYLKTLELGLTSVTGPLFHMVYHSETSLKAEFSKTSQKWFRIDQVTKP